MSERDSFADVLGERRGPPRQPPALHLAAPQPSAVERLRAFTDALVRFDDGGKPDQLARTHGFGLVEGNIARGRGDRPIYFLLDEGAIGGPVRALVLSYPGRQPETLRRGVLFIFDSEAQTS